ncbi:MAG TPA: GPP34 family phosphoprotein [Catenuloplanes sp.]|jgi:hypothetical protein
MTDVSLAEEVFLLAYDDDGVARGTGQHLDFGLAGALLLELALAGRIDVVGRHVAVVDPTPTGDAPVDAVLRRIGSDRTPRRPKDWVSRLAKGARAPVLRRLIAAGVLRQETDKVLWVFSLTRYPARDGVEPAAETDARSRMRAAVTGTGPVDPRTAALCGLVSALGWDKRVFPGLPRAQVTARLQEIRQGSWAPEAVKKAIEDVQAAMTAATVAAAAS